MNRLVMMLAFMLILPGTALGAQWIVYESTSGPGQGKHIVLISGDEEYRSEEALPLLAKILATHHGFRCTVLFAVDPTTGTIDPNNRNHIPGLKALESADLMVIFTRFRDLTDEQMQYIDNYLQSGNPVIGIRTSTHAFLPETGSKWAHYANGYDGKKEAWKDGFGRLVLGEKWISHHGRHRHQSTRGIIAPGAKSHPITRGLKDVDIWGPTDVYGVRLPLPDDAHPLVLGQVVNRSGEYDPQDKLFGMRSTDDDIAGEHSGPEGRGNLNDPMMPIAWTKTYRLPGGKVGKAFSSTIGASTDLLSQGTRRLLVNAVYWATGLEKEIPPNGAKVQLVGEYRPTGYGFRKGNYWLHRGLQVSDLR
jgi:hypothetical protein